MDLIKVTEKPDEISFDEIHELIFAAHETNRTKKGFSVEKAEKTGEELREMIGPDGKCFVALADGKLVGTVSYRIIEKKYWCTNGRIMDRILAAVHPDYRGMHVSSMLFSKVEESAREQGIEYLLSITAEANDIMRKNNTKNGYRYIDFSSPRSKYYNVVMLKWLNGCPIPKWRTDLHFYLRKAYIKLRFKPGRIKRFGI